MPSFLSATANAVKTLRFFHISVACLEKSKAEKIPETMMRRGRKDPTGWVLFMPVKDDKAKVEKK